MLAVISPAKKLDMAPVSLPDSQKMTSPQFAKDADYLAKVTGAFDTKELMALMGISENLANLNLARFHEFGKQDKKPALFAFAGDTYQGLEATSLDEPDIAWAQNHLRILSGLYGLLRPLDMIEAYRLEMGSRLTTNRGKSLYAYWGGHIAQELNRQADAVGAKSLVNCASKEYFSAVDKAVLSVPVIEPVFKDIKNGKARIVSFYAKKARGAMARFIMQNQLSKSDDLKAFSAGGYEFQADQSDESCFTFTRLDPNG